MLFYVSAHVNLSSGNGSVHVRERKEGRQACDGATPTSLKLDQLARAYLFQEGRHLLFGLDMLLGEGIELDLERCLSVCLASSALNSSLTFARDCSASSFSRSRSLLPSKRTSSSRCARISSVPAWKSLV